MKDTRAAGGERHRELGAERTQQGRERAERGAPEPRRCGRPAAAGSAEDSREDRLGVQQDTFISHLIELRERLMRALIAVLAVFVVLFLWPGSGPIYDFLAAPLMHALPEGTKMIATGVITPFMVPMKVTALVAFLIALPYVLYQAWAFVAPGLYEHEKKLAVPIIVASTAAVPDRRRVLLLLRVRHGVQVHQRLRAQVDHAGAGHRGLLHVRHHHVPRLRRDLRDPDRGHHPGARRAW